MKKFALLSAVVCLFVCGLAAQTMPADGVQVGPNIVEVIVRHADGTVFYHHVGHNLKTTYGVDYVAQNLGGSLTPITAQTINLSTDSGSPSAGDCTSTTCTLTGIVTTNGLAPHIATYAHTGGTNTYTLVNTWTATGTVANLQKAAVALQSLSSCSGLCGFVFENTFTPVTLNANDQLQITWTITIS